MYRNQRKNVGEVLYRFAAMLYQLALILIISLLVFGVMHRAAHAAEIKTTASRVVYLMKIEFDKAGEASLKKEEIFDPNIRGSDTEIINQHYALCMGVLNKYNQMTREINSMWFACAVPDNPDYVETSK